MKTFGTIIDVRACAMFQDAMFPGTTFQGTVFQGTVFQCTVFQDGCSARDREMRRREMRRPQMRRHASLRKRLALRDGKDRYYDSRLRIRHNPVFVERYLRILLVFSQGGRSNTAAGNYDIIPKPVESLVNTARSTARLPSVYPPFTLRAVLFFEGRLPNRRLREIALVFSIVFPHREQPCFPLAAILSGATVKVRQIDRDNHLTTTTRQPWKPTQHL